MFLRLWTRFARLPLRPRLDLKSPDRRSARFLREEAVRALLATLVWWRSPTRNIHTARPFALDLFVARQGGTGVLRRGKRQRKDTHTHTHRQKAKTGRRDEQYYETQPTARRSAKKRARQHLAEGMSPEARATKPQYKEQDCAAGGRAARGGWSAGSTCLLTLSTAGACVE